MRRLKVLFLDDEAKNIRNFLKEVAPIVCDTLSEKEFNNPTDEARYMTIRKTLLANCSLELDYCQSLDSRAANNVFDRIEREKYDIIFTDLYFRYDNATRNSDAEDSHSVVAGAYPVLYSLVLNHDLAEERAYLIFTGQAEKLKNSFDYLMITKIIKLLLGSDILETKAGAPGETYLVELSKLVEKVRSDLFRHIRLESRRAFVNSFTNVGDENTFKKTLIDDGFNLQLKNREIISLVNLFPIELSDYYFGRPYPKFAYRKTFKKSDGEFKKYGFRSERIDDAYAVEGVHEYILREFSQHMGYSYDVFEFYKENLDDVSHKQNKRDLPELQKQSILEAFANVEKVFEEAGKSMCSGIKDAKTSGDLGTLKHQMRFDVREFMRSIGITEGMEVSPEGWTEVTTSHRNDWDSNGKGIFYWYGYREKLQLALEFVSSEMKGDKQFYLLRTKGNEDTQRLKTFRLILVQTNPFSNLEDVLNDGAGNWFKIVHSLEGWVRFLIISKSGGASEQLDVYAREETRDRIDPVEKLVKGDGSLFVMEFDYPGNGALNIEAGKM
jgi:hypothetical protein